MRLSFRTDYVLWAALAAGLFIALGCVGKHDSLWHDLRQQIVEAPSGGQNQILLRIGIRMALFGLATVPTGWVIQAAVAPAWLVIRSFGNFGPEGSHATRAWWFTARIALALLPGSRCRIARGFTVDPQQSTGLLGLTFSPDGRQIAAAGHGAGVAVVWDAITGAGLFNVRGKTEEVNEVCFSPDGKLLAVGGLGLGIEVFDASTGKDVMTISGPRRGIRSIGYSPDGRRAVIGESYGYVKVWEAATADDLITLEDLSRTTYPSARVGFGPGVWRLYFHAQDEVRIYDSEVREPVAIPSGIGPVPRQLK